MRVVIAGSSGFLGTRLTATLLDSGREVAKLVRRPPRATDEVQWNPAGGQLDPAALAGASAVVNLAGANVGTRRWTDRYKSLLVSSRVDSTGTIARTIAALPQADRPQVFLAQSGVDFYGNTGDRPVTEADPPGEGFLADLVRVWEAASRPAEDAGVRVVHMRTGFPLSAKGGLLQPMVWQFKLFAGGALGSGRQYIPWISMADWLGAVQFLRERDDLAGAVNVVGPEPVRAAEFARALGHLLNRPSFWPVPGFALRIALGEFGGVALESRRVLPGALGQAGFGYRQPDLESALRAAVAG